MRHSFLDPAGKDESIDDVPKKKKLAEGQYCVPFWRNMIG